MTVVHKAKIEYPKTEIRMPKGAKIIHVQEQFNIPCIWYECDPKQEMEERLFHHVPTGGEVPESSEFRGTFLLSGGSFVLHLYEIIR